MTTNTYLWQTSVHSAKKAQKLLENIATLFVLQNLTHQATVVYTQIFNGREFQMVRELRFVRGV